MKIIIKHGDIKPLTAMGKVMEVIHDGFVSKGTYGEQYCFVTTWSDGVRVSADKTKNGTHVFNVWMK